MSDTFNRIANLVGKPSRDQDFRSLKGDLGELTIIAIVNNDQDQLVVYPSEGVMFWCFHEWTVAAFIHLNGDLRSGVEELHLKRLQDAGVKTFKRTLFQGVCGEDTRAVVHQKLGQPISSKKYHELSFKAHAPSILDHDYVDYYEFEQLDVRFMFDSSNDLVGWVDFKPRDIGTLVEKLMP